MNNNSKFRSFNQLLSKSKPWYKRVSLFIASVCILFLIIGQLTTIQPAYRLSSSTINEWTSQINGSSFLYLMQMENRTFELAFPDEVESIEMSDLFFEMATSVKPNDPRSLLGRELPGFDAYDRKIVVAGEGTNFTNLAVESSPPLDVVLEERPTNVTDKEIEGSDIPDQSREDQPTTGDKDVVFIYTTHNRESYLPHISGATEPNDAFHSEVNITNVSERLAKSLRANGIGTQVDKTDIPTILSKNDWGYPQSYSASKSVVKQALANNREIQYIFDLHRDAQRKDITTAKIDGKNYAKLYFIIGSDNPNYEKNLKLATDLHDKIDEQYPGLSRGVEMQGGTGNNGVYNQDLSGNAILIEFGGVDNTFEELYRTADVLAEIFSEYYWEAEKVQGTP
ncbi:stage II sporulation protein P [Aquibacillus albus]|uniref:Stage II sporulation protein P n=1 Tax=Aquibacillus albus TaxID=1168171 RepID=A0ABS2MUS8_9BACI|nr:stage II sporulation protein P [Aquibacillus albus]MBM7569607.1 stage II sporulation protein P [Aquibacillus albus]